MPKFRDFLEKENVNENSSAGAVGGGAIASSPAVLGHRRRNPKETIFAVSNEEEGNVVQMGGERQSKNHLSPQQLTMLRNRYAGLKGIDPESPTYAKLIKFLDGVSDTILLQLAKADINFVSKLAQNRVMRRGLEETIFAMSNEEEGDDTERNPDPVKDRHWKGNRKLARDKKRKIGPNDLEEKQGSDRIKDDPCWKGYKMVGKKEKGGKEVPNCVPESKGIDPDTFEEIAMIRRRAGITD